MKKRKIKKRKSLETASATDQSPPAKLTKREIRDILSKHDDLLMLNLTRGQRKRAKQKLKLQQMQQSAGTRSKPSVELAALADSLKHRDVQTLVSHALQPYVHTARPEWCKLHNPSMVKKIVVAMVSYLAPAHVSEQSDCFPALLKIFPQALPLLSPGSSEFAKSGLDAFLSVAAKRKKKQSITNKQVPGREFYLLSAKDLDENGFPISTETMHTVGIDKAECHEAHMDRNGYTKLPLTAIGDMTESTEDGEIADFDYSHAPMFAVDCEMCQTAAGYELTRVSVVDESLSCLYDTLVVPENPILDYKTKYSGITAETLKNVTKRLRDVQKELVDLLPANAILMGHSLENDLHSLKLVHDAVIDTTVLYTTPEARSRFKPSLKYLSRKHLGRKIQTSNSGHCSVEDAEAVMGLVKLKLEKGPEFGIPEDTLAESYFAHLAERGKQVYFVDQPFFIQRYCDGSRVHSVVCCGDDNETVSKACQCVSKADLLWVHLHDVEKQTKAMQDGEHSSTDKLKPCLRAVDSSINTLYNKAPGKTLFIVIAGSGNLHEVKRLHGVSPADPGALTKAVMAARSGLVYVTIKDGEDEQQVESCSSKDDEMDANKSI